MKNMSVNSRFCFYNKIVKVTKSLVEEVSTGYRRVDNLQQVRRTQAKHFI